MIWNTSPLPYSDLYLEHRTAETRGITLKSLKNTIERHQQRPHACLRHVEHDLDAERGLLRRRNDLNTIHKNAVLCSYSWQW